MTANDKATLTEWFTRQKECMEASRSEQNKEFIDGVAYGIVMAQAIVDSYPEEEFMKLKNDIERENKALKDFALNLLFGEASEIEISNYICGNCSLRNANGKCPFDLVDDDTCGQTKNEREMLLMEIILKKYNGEADRSDNE